MADKEKSIEDLITIGSEIVGSATGGVMSFFVGGPVGAGFGSAGGVVVAKGLTKLGIEVKNWLLGKREEVRIGAVISYAVIKIQQNIAQGKPIRNDDFFVEKVSARSDADEIYEGLIIAAQKEHEEKKIKYMGNMLGNIVFSQDIDKSFANLLINEVDNLSYRQLCLLKLFYENHETALRQTNFGGIRIPTEVFPILYEILDLDLKELIINRVHQVNGITDIVPKECAVQALGSILYSMLELNSMPDEEVINLRELLS